MIDSYLTDNVTWRKAGGLDEYNEVQAGTDEVIKARVEWKNSLIRDNNGQQVVAAGFVLVKAKPEPTDQLVIDGAARGILAIERKQDFQTRYYKLFIA